MSMHAGGRWIAAAALAWGCVTAASAAPAISIVIDDLGDKLSSAREVLALPGPIACAFLPESPHTRRLAEQAHAVGKPVMLHLPLEPLSGPVHPLAVSARTPVDQRREQLLRLLASVPHARGVNNHQGSRGTEDRLHMHWLMGELSAAGIDYFVDSATSPHSQAYRLARAYGLPATRRKVFLDNDPHPEAVRIEFERLLALARRDGGALAIGHPHPATLALLRERLPHLKAAGIEVVSPAQLIARMERRPPLYPVQLRLSTQLATLLPTAAAESPRSH